MISPKYLTTLALVAVFSAGAEAGALQSGVCYSPWHHPTVDDAVVQSDLAQIKEMFSSFRSYHARFGQVNVVDAAAQAGIKVAVGIMMQDRGDIQNEITAACEGAQRHPEAVAAIYCGNENLQNGDFGQYSADELLGYMGQLRECTNGLNIPIGSVQRINEWLSAPGADQLAGASDSIGVNIYPFFTPGDASPIDKFKAQYDSVEAKYPGKVAVTETGWPRQGSATADGNTPSQAITQSFFDDYINWVGSKKDSYYFMMYDTTTTYGGGDYEKYFGLADTSNQMQIQVPSGGDAPAPEPETPAPETPAPETPAPETPAPETPAPETPAPETPAPETPAPETPAPETPEPESPHQGEVPETPVPEPESPHQGEVPEPETGGDADETPEPETESPVVTPAPGKMCE